MGLLVYQFGPYRTTHEREQFRILCSALQEYYAKNNEWCIFLSNYNIYDSELDGLLIKQDAIICVEFKKYGGEITAVDNGQWKTADGTVIKGGSGKTVYQQANINHICTRKGLKAATSLSNKQLSDIAALVVFHRPITTLYNNLSEVTQCWLHITDNNHFIEKVQDITTDKLYLEPYQMQKLIHELALDDYYLLEEYSNRELLEQDFEKEEVPVEIEVPFQPINEIKRFSPKEMVNENTKPKITQDSPISPLPIFSAYNREEVEIWAKTIFHDLRIDKFIEVYDTIIDTVPSWVINERGYRFVVVSFMFHDEVQAFEQYTHLQVRHHKTYNYWFCDAMKEPSSNAIIEEVANLSTDNNLGVEHLTQFDTFHYTLPSWLDNVLYEKLGAQYAPDYESFSTNLGADKEKNKVYLGTYFPRSCAESYFIAKNLFKNPIIKERLKNREVLSILDIACGTGGEVMGMLFAIFDMLPDVKHVSICAIDGNLHALNFFKKVLLYFKEMYPTKMIEVSNAAIPVSSIEDLQLLSDVISDDFDFILSNKSGNELLSILKSSDNVYEVLLNSFAQKLSANGLMWLLDVASKNKNGKYCPIDLNEAFNNFVKLHPEFRSIVPVACALYENKCSQSCYTQRLIRVSHSKKVNDISKFSYRIIARAELAKAVLFKTKENQYVITPDKEEKCCCPYSQGDTLTNAFIINQ